jgi:Putative  PD-(D/E)XK family member, (DUF4420)
MLDLFELFKALPSPTGEDPAIRYFSAAAPWGSSSFRLARSSDGRPYFMVPAARDRYPTGVRLEHLSVEPGVRCVVIEPDRTSTTDTYVLIGCTSDDTELQAFFLRVIAAFVKSFGDKPAESTVRRGIELLVSLFKALSQPARKSIRGFWAELFIIAESEEPTMLLDAWHGSPLDLYDFSQGGDRLEVKSSVDKREHRFRREQLIPVEGCRLVIASVIVRSAGGGATVADLVTRIGSLDGMDGPRLEKLSRIAAETLGQDWRLGITLRFDEQGARQSLEFYDGPSIPALRDPLPPEISDVHFTVDMSRTLPIQDNQWQGIGSLAQAANPSARKR